MPFSHGSKAKVYLGGYDITLFTRDVTSSGDADMAETSVLGDSDKDYIKGLAGGDVTLEGFLEGTSTVGAEGNDVIMEAALGEEAGLVLAHLPAGDVFGAKGRYLAAFQAGYEIDTSIDGAGGWTAELSGKVAPVVSGAILQILGAVTADGQGSGFDSGIVGGTPNGGAGFLEVTAFSGFTSVLFRVQHSTDGSIWSDLLTFTSITAARKSERVAVAGTVNRHLRAWWDVTGVGSVTFHMGFARR